MVIAEHSIPCVKTKKERKKESTTSMPVPPCNTEDKSHNTQCLQDLREDLLCPQVYWHCKNFLTNSNGQG